jgi:conjugative relaxase-like TrwC/TraI family protein
MLRFTPIENARQAEHYYSVSDGGYYLGAGDLHREWGGKAAAMLGLTGRPDYEQFKRLINGLDPETGEQLTAKLIDDRVPGWDVTASVPKGVTTALERGDGRIREVIWQAGRQAMAELEELAATRVRKGGRQEDRETGNLVWYATEHPETRPTKQDGMPDWDRHIHFVVFNETLDPVEQQWKAVKFRPIMDLHKWFSTRFDMYVASGMADLGYEIETKYKADDKGGRKYYSWDIKGIPESVIKNFSRRSAEVDATEKEILDELKEEKGIELDQLSAVARDKLGATSRRVKRDDMTLANYRDYWDGRISPEEGRQIAETIERAAKGLNPEPTNTVDKAVDFAIQHMYERNSVVRATDLTILAMERSMGAGLPDDILPEARRQGVLLKNGEATHRTVLEEESRIIGFASEGKGKMPPLRDASATAPPRDFDKLSAEQKTICRHIWESPDQMGLVRGAPGVGKTFLQQTAFDPIPLPKAFLAPTAEAGRGALREAFPDANTVAAFLRDTAWQERMRNGIVVVDEFGLLPIKDLTALCDIAREKHFRIWGFGDDKQHRSVARHGNMFHALATFAGLKIPEMKDVQRQRGQYREAAIALRDGKLAKALGIFERLSWIKRVKTQDVCKAVADKWCENAEKNMRPVVSGITHKQNAEITAELRKRLKAKGEIAQDETIVDNLRPLNWTEAEKGDLEGQYDGSEVIQFVRNVGPFKAGQRVGVDELRACQSRINPKNYAVYAPGQIGLSAGDVLMTTAGGRSREGQRIENGQRYVYKGQTKDGNLIISTGKHTYTLDRAWKHFQYGFVNTSYKVQSRTDPSVISVMTKQAYGALNAPQCIVDLTRGKFEATIVTDMAPDELKAAMQRQDRRKSAHELMAAQKTAKPGPKLREKAQIFAKAMRKKYRQLRDWAVDAITGTGRQERGVDYGYAR